MKRALRIVLRLAVVLAVVAALQLVVDTPRDTGGTPYVSSLTSLGVSAALAAPGCNTKYCSKEPGRRTPTCIQVNTNYNCAASGGVCAVSAC